MIDSVAVVEGGASTRAVPQPPEILACDGVPPIRGHAPVLAGCAEGVRWDANRRVHVEVGLMRPHVSAVTINHERQVAEQLDAGFACGSAGAAPLFIGYPLKVLTEQDLIRQLPSSIRDRVAVTISQPRRPFMPRPPFFAFVQCAEQRVVVNPPAFAFDIRLERTRARGLPIPFVFAETGERQAQRQLLQRTYGSIVDVS